MIKIWGELPPDQKLLFTLGVVIGFTFEALVTIGILSYSLFNGGICNHENTTVQVAPPKVASSEGLQAQNGSEVPPPKVGTEDQSGNGRG